MNITTARRTTQALVVALILISAAPAGAAKEVPLRARPRPRPGPVDARVEGRFAMLADVTAAVNVAGERPGQRFRRRWLILPGGCKGSVCRTLFLARERGNGRYEHLRLRRTGPGRYSGGGVIYVGLDCAGRLYGRGSRAPFRITLTVSRSKLVQGVRFARTVSATYVNPDRSDSTPCPLGPSHDAARYTGHNTSPLPAPPRAAFTDRVESSPGTVAFTDTTTLGSPAPIVAQRWYFGDPQSPYGDTSSAKDPTQRFPAPGTYTVSLLVEDANGLIGLVSHVVVVPATAPRPRPLEITSDASTAFSSSTSRTAATRPGWITA